MRTLTADTRIRLNQIKDLKQWVQDKHGKSVKEIPEGAVRRWKDGRLHEKTAHGWVTVPQSKEYDVQINKAADKKNKNQIIPGRQVSQKEFNNFIDELYKNPHPRTNKAIRLPQLRRGLMKQVGLDTNNTFIFSTRYYHISPERKSAENQAFTKEEYKQIPTIIKNAKYAVLEKGTGDFKIIFKDKNNPQKYNKIVFSKTNKGNYLITLAKIDKNNIYNPKKEKIVGEGVTPSI